MTLERDLSPLARDIIQLTELEYGVAAEIIKVYSPGLTHIYLTQLGFIKGNKITKIKSAPLGNPIEVVLNNNPNHIMIRIEEANNILVERLEKRL